MAAKSKINNKMKVRTSFTSGAHDRVSKVICVIIISSSSSISIIIIIITVIDFIGYIDGTVISTARSTFRQ